MALFEQNNSTHREGSFVDGSIGGSGGDVCFIAMAYDWSVWISCEYVDGWWLNCVRRCELL